MYNTACFYEIVILNYFMSFSKCDVLICSLDGNPVKTMEGYSVNVDMALKDIDKAQIRSFIIPGGNVSSIDNEEVRTYLQELKSNNVLIAGICAGVDVLDHAGKLQGIKSTHTYMFSLGDRGLSQAEMLSCMQNADGSTIICAKFHLETNPYADGISEPMFLYTISAAEEIVK